MSLFVPNSNSFVTNSCPGAAVQDMTVCVWLYLPSATPTNYRDIFSTIQSNGTANIALTTFTDGVTIDFGTNNSDNNGPVLPLATWNHISMTVNCLTTTSRIIKGYVNGNLVVNVSDTATFAATTTQSIGYNSTPGILNANVRDLRYWKRVLNGVEIKSECMSRAPTHLSGLQVWSPFDVDIYADKSGNGFAWTNTGCSLQGLSSPRANPAWMKRSSRIFF